MYVLYNWANDWAHSQYFGLFLVLESEAQISVYELCSLPLVSYLPLFSLHLLLVELAVILSVECLNMNALTSTSLCNHQISRFPFTVSNPRNISPFPSRVFFKLYANANTNELDTQAQAVEEPKQELEADPKEAGKASPASPLDKDLKKVGFFSFDSTGVP